MISAGAADGNRDVERRAAGADVDAAADQAREIDVPQDQLERRPEVVRDHRIGRHVERGAELAAVEEPLAEVEVERVGNVERGGPRRRRQVVRPHNTSSCLVTTVPAPSLASTWTWLMPTAARAHRERAAVVDVAAVPSTQTCSTPKLGFVVATVPVTAIDA